MFGEVSLILERIPKQLFDSITAEQLETASGIGKQVEYKCAKCEVNFPTKNHLKYHLKFPDDIYEGNSFEPMSYECDDCGETFDQIINYHRHWLYYHLTNLKCSKCPSTLKRARYLSLHMLNYHNIVEKPPKFASVNCVDITKNYGTDYFCARCEKRLPTKTHLRQHFRVNHQSYGASYVEIHRCDYIQCGKSFSRFNSFRTHWLIHEPPQLICTECPATFRHQQSLKVHLLKRHNKLEKPNSFDCEQCGKVLRNTQQLSCHVAYHKAPQFNCTECGKTFFQSIGLHCHVRHAHRKSTQVKSDSWTCPICHKQFANAISLSDHAAIHKPKQFKCSMCVAQFYRHCDLDSHQTFVHDIEVDKRTKCDVCGKEFRSPQGLRLHKRFHSSPTVSCSSCDQTFYTKGSLTRHVQIAHTAIFAMPTSSNKHPTCAVCCRPCGSKDFLIRHLPIHYPYRKLHKCHICQRIFHSSGSLRSHLRLIHNHK